jgi:UDP-glucose 4-epimerase
MADGQKIIKAVVTGGAGFIGSHIADKCVERGWQVTILDNLSTGRMENINLLINAITQGTSDKSKRNTKLQDENQVQNFCEFVYGSITDLPVLQHIFKGADYIFHEAAMVSVPGSIEEPVLSHETNLTGTLNVLLAAREAGVKKVVFASSSAVYGDTSVLYKREDSLPKPQSPYAVNKLAAEYYCRVFEEVYGLRTVCLRYFNVYGPRQRPDSDYAAVIPRFIRMIREGNPPIIYGDGAQTRDFVFVKDVASTNILVAESDATGIFNVGTGESTNINQLSSIILAIFNRNDIKSVHARERPGDIKNSLADVTRIKDLGYLPEYGLQDGLREIIKGVRVKGNKY